MPTRRLRDNAVVRLIRTTDMFGHKIHFNTNGEKSHRTIFGACATILIFLSLAWVLVYLLFDIVIFDRDRPLTTILYPNYYGEKNQPLQ